MGSQESTPSPGDLIEVLRATYEHWAVYVGSGYVVHLVNLGQGRGKIKRERLDEVAGNSRWRVNNKMDGILTPRSAHEIVTKAMSMVGDDRKYNILVSNCEHFAMWLRYDIEESSQVIQGAAAAAVGTAVGAGLAIRMRCPRCGGHHGAQGEPDLQHLEHRRSALMLRATAGLTAGAAVTVAIWCVRCKVYHLEGESCPLMHGN